MSKTQQRQAEEQATELYDRAEQLEVGCYLPRHGERFRRAVIDEVDVEVWESEYRVAEISGYTDGAELELLLVYPDGTRQFVGEDETAKAASRMFSFVIRPCDPHPPVRTATEALDLLKPPGVNRALANGEVGRQGEWWLLPDKGKPEGSVFKPGVAKRPFGASPLENHVPREYGFGISDDELVDRFIDRVPELSEWIDTAEDAVWHISKAHQLLDLDGFELITDVPLPSELRELAGGVFVKGTLRHRESEHYVETIGDEWHLAETHDMDVWTVDSFQFATAHKD